MFPIIIVLGAVFQAVSQEAADNLAALPLLNWRALSKIPTPLDEHIPNDDGRFVSHVPMPLSQPDVATIVEYLSLAPPQILYLDGLLKQYKKDIDSVRTERMADVSYWSSQAVVFLDDKPMHAEMMARFVREESIARQSVLGAEQHLYESLTEILSDHQRTDLSRVRNWRSRTARCTTFVETPSARIDLISFSGALANEPKIAAILAEYDARIVPLFESLTRELLATRVAESNLRANLVLTGDRSSDAPRLDAYFKETAEIRLPGARVEARIRDVNAEFAARVAQALAPDLGRPYLLHFREAAYPKAFPDVGYAGATVRDIAANCENREVLRRGLRSIADSYESAYEAKCVEIMRESDKMYEQIALTGAMRGLTGYLLSLKTLAADRARLSSALLRQVRDLLVQERIETWSTTIDDLMAANDAALSKP